MKKLKIILGLSFLLSLNIFATPAHDILEITATFCHFSETGLRCACSEEAKENRNEQRKVAKKVRKEKV